MRISVQLRRMQGSYSNQPLRHQELLQRKGKQQIHLESCVRLGPQTFHNSMKLEKAGGGKAEVSIKSHLRYPLQMAGKDSLGVIAQRIGGRDFT